MRRALRKASLQRPDATANEPNGRSIAVVLPTPRASASPLPYSLACLLAKLRPKGMKYYEYGSLFLQEWSLIAETTLFDLGERIFVASTLKHLSRKDNLQMKEGGIAIWHSFNAVLPSRWLVLCFHPFALA